MCHLCPPPRLQVDPCSILCILKTSSNRFSCYCSRTHRTLWATFENCIQPLRLSNKSPGLVHRGFLPWEHPNAWLPSPLQVSLNTAIPGKELLIAPCFGLPELRSHCCSHCLGYFRAVSPAQGRLPTGAECHYERRLLWAATITGNLSLRATSIMNSFTKWLWICRAWHQLCHPHAITKLQTHTIGAGERDITAVQAVIS